MPLHPNSVTVDENLTKKQFGFSVFTNSAPRLWNALSHSQTLRVRESESSTAF